MDRSKLDQQLDRRMDKIDRLIAKDKNQDRFPIEEYDRMFFRTEFYYEDAKVEAKVILCKDRIKATIKGVMVDTYGPWVLFKVEDVLEGDPDCLIDLGAAILARWNSGSGSYKKYLYKADPQIDDLEVAMMASLTSATETEIVKGFVK